MAATAISIYKEAANFVLRRFILGYNQVTKTGEQRAINAAIIALISNERFYAALEQALVENALSVTSALAALNNNPPDEYHTVGGMLTSTNKEACSVLGELLPSSLLFIELIRNALEQLKISIKN